MTQFTLTSDIERGRIYEFRLRAFNIHGWGDWSDTTLIKAAGIPFTPAPVTTSFDPITGGVVIKWVAPHDNSQKIEKYFVEIQSAELLWFEDQLNCDGTQLITTQCLIPVPTLTSAPYNLPFDSIVVVRLQARNFFGFGLKSTPNTEGVRIRRIPSKMGPIQVVLKTDTEITLSWSLLTGT